jgi:uncharacterized membrane protein
MTSGRALFARGAARPIHPLHAIVLAFCFPLFLSAWLADLAYSSSYHVQWINFASWLIVGGLVGSGLTLGWSIIDLVRDRSAREQRHLIYAALLLVIFVLGFINALVHAKDAWATMPAGLWLSFVTAALALIASWIGFSGLRAGATP